MAATLLHRALNLPNTSEGKEQELNHVYVTLESNGYPSINLFVIYKPRKLNHCQIYPLRNLLECFLIWLNLPSHASLSRLFHTSKV